MYNYTKTKVPTEREGVSVSYKEPGGDYLDLVPEGRTRIT